MLQIYSTARYGGGAEQSRRLLRGSMIQYLMQAGADPAAAKQTTDDALSRLRRGPKGKPEIPGFAQFSVSHSAACWAVLFDTEGPCGLDIQIEKPAHIERIARRCFGSEGAALVTAQGNAAFYRLWTRREAYIKAQGAAVLDRTPPFCDADGAYREHIRVSGANWYLRELPALWPVAVAGGRLYAAICTQHSGAWQVFHL